MSILTLAAMEKPSAIYGGQPYSPKEHSHQEHVAPEKFSSRILTWLGKVPAFKNMDAVRKHAENTKVQEQQKLQQFLQALADKYGEKTVKDVVFMSGINLEKPLTQRLAQQLTDCAERANVGLFNLIKTKKNVGDIIIKGGDTKVVAQHSDPHTEVKQQLLTITINGLNKVIPELENVDATSLRENFLDMASGNGPLRKLMTNLQNLNLIPEANRLNVYAIKLKNMQVGVAPFSQWGTNGGEVAKWIGGASEQELSQAVNRIHAITKELKNIKNALGHVIIGESGTQPIAMESHLNTSMA
ncbi:type III secretion system effector BopA family protein [Salmonella bongori]|nr:type III secretion system effector BopA family protein [Salmonella bongori]